MEIRRVRWALDAFGHPPLPPKGSFFPSSLTWHLQGIYPVPELETESTWRKKKKEYGRKEEKQQVQPFPKDSWQKPPGGSDQSVPFRTSQLVTHRVWTGSLPGPAGISASTALVSIFLVISSRAFSGIMSRGQDGMGSYGRIVQINIIEGTGVLGEGGKESFWK